MSQSSKVPVILLFVVIALAAAAGGLWLARATQPGNDGPVDQATLRDGPFLRLPQAKAIADFALYDATGAPWSREGLTGEWTLVFFGFTSCPHICPDTMFKLTQVTQQLEENLPPGRVPNVLMIAVDPVRDTPEALKQYQDRFDGEIEAVSGPDAQLRALAMQLGAHYVIPPHEPGEWYNVDHSLGVLLLNPEAEWVGVFSAPHEIEAMAGSLQRFLVQAQPAYGGG